MRIAKYLVILMMGLGLTSEAFASDAFLSQFKAGKWEGQVVNTVTPDFKGKKLSATTEVAGDTVKVKVVWDGATGQTGEEWKITPTQLIQTEYDASGKVIGTYAADARKGSTATGERTYDVHCANREAKECDNGIDPNNHWILKTDGARFDYVVRGLKDAANPASLGDRHFFQLKYLGQ